MDPIKPQDRKVASLSNSTFQPILTENGRPDGEVLQVNGGKIGFGFHIYRMAPGTTTQAHTQLGCEEFFLIDGDLTDHDGYKYKPGDIVCLASGAQHNSPTVNDCTLIVNLPGAEGI